MQDTSLSPRLRHLLISEDRSTGKLIIPTSSDLRSSIGEGSGICNSSLGLGFNIGIPNSKSNSASPLSIKNQLSPSSRSSSPPLSSTAISPRSLGFDISISPNGKKRPLPIDIGSTKLPSLPLSLPTTSPISTTFSSSVSYGGQRSSIFSLLNGHNILSPPSSASSIGSSSIRQEEKEREKYLDQILDLPIERRVSSSKTSKESRKISPTPYTRPRLISQPSTSTTKPIHSISLSPTVDGFYHNAPFTAPIITHEQSMYFDSKPIPTQTQNNNNHQYYPPHTSQGILDETSRPGLLRRHSSHPYEYSSPSQQHQQRPTTAYATGPIYEADYPNSMAMGLGMGARAPISRTTKACNACRNRKVRCDAGGGDMGACSRCLESGTQCVYTGVQKKRGPCPGTARPSISKPRRPSSQSQISSHRSSVASLQSVQSYVVTPTEEQAPWSTRSSYGFPPSFSQQHQRHQQQQQQSQQKQPDPSEWSSTAPSSSKNRSSSTSINGIPSNKQEQNQIDGRNQSIISWSSNGIIQNHDHSDRPSTSSTINNMFEHEYAVGPRGSICHDHHIIPELPKNNHLRPAELS
ncbi:uncharacterized protein L201_007246 [Kwoniella dendrophila CBS 6074]|uniref:Zn(2)-C6 fungal-type domain-containing protein n=1 Tax=Kwoniella dendrophila CBS 6074 TaxID=1295534 RepID=A0AAX4K607_9TREE